MKDLYKKKRADDRFKQEIYVDVGLFKFEH